MQQAQLAQQAQQAQQTQPTQLIPLTSIVVNGYMLDNLGKITCEMSFEGVSTNTINPIHYFSLDSSATICDFTMMVGTKIFRGEVQEKSQAKQTYTQAQTEGKKTALIEKISPTDYKVSVGNVEPNAKVIVSFDYTLTLITDEESRYMFSIPTNISVKYTPDTTNIVQNSSNQPNLLDMTYSN